MMATSKSDSEDWFKYFLSPETLDAELGQLSRVELSRLLCFFLSQGYQAFQTSQNHLLKERPACPNPESGEIPMQLEERVVSTHKVDVMDILALKVAAHVQFNLNFLQDSLPAVLQDRLLRKLLQLATGISKFDPFHDVGWPAWTPVGRFAHTLFHRWSLKISVDIDFATYKPSRSEPVNIPLPKGLTEIPPKIFEKGNASVNNFIKTNRQLFIDRLSPYLHRTNWSVAVPTPRCFVYPRSDSACEEVVEQRWEYATPMPVSDFQALIAYDIGRYLFQERQFSQAETIFGTAKQHLGHLTSSSREYATLSRVAAYLTACESVRGVRKSLPSARRQLMDLVDRLAGQERGRRPEMRLSDDLVRSATAVLLGDTISRRNELSRIERDDFEANLLPMWDTLHFAVLTCNLLHRVMAGQALLSLYAEKMAAQGDAGVSYLLSCVSQCLADARDNERMNIKCFLWYLLQALPDESEFAATLLATEGVVRHFDRDEQAVIRQQLEGKSLAAADDAFMELEELEFRDDDASDPWFVEEEYEEEDAVDAGPSGAAAVDAMRLLTSYDPEEIRILIDRLLDSPTKSYSCVGLARLSDKWRVRPEAFDRMLLGLVSSSVNFVYLYVLVAKAQLLKGLEEWEGAYHLLSTAERVSETADTAYRVHKLVRQELCLLNMQSFLARASLLGGKGRGGEAELVQAGKALLTGLRIDAEAVVAEEVAVTAVCFLLSTGHGAYLMELWTGLGPQSASCGANGALHLAAILCRLSADADEMTKAGCRELWDFLCRCLPIVPGAGSGNQSNHMPLQRDLFLLFLRLLRERRHLSLLLSALIAMCKQQLTDLNILIYPGNKALLDFWPSASCVNVNQDSLQEAVHVLLDSGLTKFPNECSWLLTRAELAYSQRHYKRALMAYLECGAAATDFFSQPVPEELFSRQTLQRMLRCCEEMRFYGQAAVMCQLATTEQGETDYKSAVRFLKMQEESLDTIDSYLPFIWDVTLLELAAAICGQRYGAVEKRARIVAAISRPEVNMASKADVKHNIEVQKRLALLRLMCEQHFL